VTKSKSQGGEEGTGQEGSGANKGGRESHMGNTKNRRGNTGNKFVKRESQQRQEELGKSGFPKPKENCVQDKKKGITRRGERGDGHRVTGR